MELYEQTFIVEHALVSRGNGPMTMTVTLRADGEFDGNLMHKLYGARVALVAVDS